MYFVFILFEVKYFKSVFVLILMIMTYSSWKSAMCTFQITRIPDEKMIYNIWLLKSLQQITASLWGSM